jgi:hypothetical protein
MSWKMIPGHFGYFDDPDQRCAFCAPPDFEP